MKFSERLKKVARPIWDKGFTHPFVQRLGDATLTKEKFEFYLCQDYALLTEFNRVLALGAIKAPDFSIMEKFSWLLSGNVNERMNLYKKLSMLLGISEQALEKAKIAPTAMAYSSYLSRVAHEKDFLHLAVLLLPRFYSHTQYCGRLLAENSKGLEHIVYGEWIRLNASAGIAAYGDWLFNLADELADAMPQRYLDGAESVFIRCAQYDYMFFDMAYREEKWLIEE